MKIRPWKQAAMAVGMLLTGLVLFGCGRVHNRNLNEFPVLLSYEEGTVVQYRIDLNNQFYDFSHITIDYDDKDSHEILFYNEEMKVIGREQTEGMPFSFDISEDMSYISFEADSGAGETVTARGILSEKGQTDRKGETIETSRFMGKNLSILGDSISAYAGYIPTGYISQYPSGDVVLSDMWWYRTAKRLGMNICKVNACSGSGVTEYAWAYGSVERLWNDKRGTDLHMMKEIPDLVIVWLGANDVFGGAPEAVILENYEKLVRDIQETYKEAEVYLCTYYNSGSEAIWLNQDIRALAEELDVKIIDLEQCGITEEKREQYLQPDGLHPNQKGFQLIGAWVTEQLLKDGESYGQ